MSDIGFEESSDYFKEMEIFTGQKTVRVLIENSNDADIWNDALPIKDNLVFEYATVLDVAEEFNLKVAEGCTQLNKIGHYHLGDNLIMCKDSDYSYIAYLMKKIIDNSTASYVISDYIFETIVHSKENIVFYENFVLNHFANRVKVHPSLINAKAPWLKLFYFNFSKIIFTPMLKLIYHDSILHFRLKKNQIGFNKINSIFKGLRNIPLNNIQDFNVFFESRSWKRVEREISAYEKTIDKIILENKLTNEIDFIVSKIGDYNVGDNNFYHFYKGHFVEEIFESIFKKYLDIIYESEVKLKCKNLNTERATKMRAEYKNTKKEFDLKDEVRDLNQHNFFSQTYNRLLEMY